MRQKTSKRLGLLSPLPKELSDWGDVDIEKLLAFQRREIVLAEQIDETNAARLIQLLRYLDAMNEELITFFVNSDGGDVYSSLALINTMRGLRSPLRTVCLGNASSMATLLLAAGDKGKRYALKYARFMIHQPSDILPASGSETKDNAQVRAAELNTVTSMMADLYTQFGSQKKLMYLNLLKGTDKYMSPTKAKSLGLVDHVVDGLQAIK